MDKNTEQRIAEISHEKHMLQLKGPQGCGKSNLLKEIAELLKKHGYRVEESNSK